MSTNFLDYKKLELLKLHNHINWDDQDQTSEQDYLDSYKIDQYIQDVQKSPQFVIPYEQESSSQSHYEEIDVDYFSFDKKPLKEIQHPPRKEYVDSYEYLLERVAKMQISLDKKDQEINQLKQIVQSQQTVVGSNESSVLVFQQKQLITELQQKNYLLSLNFDRKSALVRVEIQNQTNLNQKLLQVVNDMKDKQTPKRHTEQNNKLKEHLDQFVQTTITLDELYYTLLQNLDEEIIKTAMHELESLSSRRKSQLERVYSLVNG